MNPKPRRGAGNSVRSVDCLRPFGASRERVTARPNGRLAGWTVLAGRNGSGKSTLLKVIALSLINSPETWSLAGFFGGWIRSGQQNADVSPSTGLYQPLSPKGDPSIQVFGLNRINLTRGRVDAWTVLNELLVVYVRCRKAGDEERLTRSRRPSGSTFLRSLGRPAPDCRGSGRGRSDLRGMPPGHPVSSGNPGLD
jgi:energy-coupling factor transporter ATP-binding protein EcfA2